jgi:hypothetical protein
VAVAAVVVGLVVVVVFFSAVWIRDRNLVGRI